MVWWLLFACAGTSTLETDTDTDADTDPDTDADTFDGCDVTEIRYDGPAEPVVGDVWTVWMYCDDALMMGAMVIRFEPTDMASFDENVLTWVKAGTGVLTIQAGSTKAELEVTVAEAR